ncbi:MULTISPECIES: hypothetical protein [unclassified Ensifer]|uniref:hypothetical protein n=1 Tax=unclassified Ensifer TaxID=2633371 RepID=UPI000B8003D1|nr:MULTISPECIES: hypothetical protein [unclassified Ensifer]MBD9598069.1 IS6 family transposase [Ensifer sp. ENS05]
MPHRDPLYRRHRFPAEVIAHAVWLYFRFPLSLRMVEDLLAARGIIVSHQTIRQWAENSHQPVRRRERIMKRFKSRRHLQRFISIHDPIANLFHIHRHDIPSSHHRELRAAVMNLWVKIARS